MREAVYMQNVNIRVFDRVQGLRKDGIGIRVGSDLHWDLHAELSARSMDKCMKQPPKESYHHKCLNITTSHCSPATDKFSSPPNSTNVARTLKRATSLLKIVKIVAVLNGLSETGSKIDR